MRASERVQRSRVNCPIKIKTRHVPAQVCRRKFKKYCRRKEDRVNCRFINYVHTRLHAVYAILHHTQLEQLFFNFLTVLHMISKFAKKNFFWFCVIFANFKRSEKLCFATIFVNSKLQQKNKINLNFTSIFAIFFTFNFLFVFFA